MKFAACRSFFAALVLLLASARPAAAAELRLASAFSDDMVLQRGKPVRVWGEADANAKVEVTLGDARQAATADASGRWQLSLDAMKATAEPLTLRASSGAAEASVRGVTAGDVWLCAGQSNMAMGLRETEGGAAEVRDAAKQTRIRLLTIPRRAAGSPQARFDAKWRVCSPETAATFTAVGYYFGAELLRDPALAGVPVGLIDCSFGGTAAEAWTSPAALKAFAPGDLLPSMFCGPGQLYDGMIAPLAPFPLAGVLWYQGESNGARADLYPRVLSTMIADWRKSWDDVTLPFFIVQLPPFSDARFTWVREAQARVAAETPHTALAVTIDTTDGHDLHPREKREIGRRLAMLARRTVYGQDAVVARGPVFKAAEADGSTMRVTFDTGGDGLVSRLSGAEAPVKGFAVAGADGVYRYAEGTIEGDATVVLRCDAVPTPKTVRYAWTGIPEVSLTNKSGLPAVPFRTDEFPPSLVEVQPQPLARRVSMPAYELEVNGMGRVTSLAVRGKQFLSNGVGAAGGTSIPSFFGPRSLQNVRVLGPDLLSFGDSDATLLLSFAEQRMEWTVENRGKDPIPFRVALSPRVTVVNDKAAGRLTVSRDKSSLAVTGIDAITDGEDGKVLEVKVPGGQTKRIVLDASGG